MSVNILMPALSPTMEEGTLTKWLVKEGDRIQSGDLIAEIETDKATMEFEAVDEGIIGKILISEGSEGVKVNSPIAVILDEGEELEANEEADQTLPAKPKNQKNAPEGVIETKKPSNNVIQTSHTRIFATPLARRLAKEKGVDLDSIRGSEHRGRIVQLHILDVIHTYFDATPYSLELSSTRIGANTLSPRSIIDH